MCLYIYCKIIYVNVNENILNVHFRSPEKDYPPVARAGNDVVIVLPVDHVTLYGNGSTDDKVQPFLN